MTDRSVDGGAWPPGKETLRFEHRGKAGELLPLALRNFILTLATFGIYRFCARTRVREYLWRKTVLLGDGLDYTGEGRDLFKGFLRAVAVVFAPLVLLDVDTGSVRRTLGGNGGLCRPRLPLLCLVRRVCVVVGAALPAEPHRLARREGRAVGLLLVHAAAFSLYRARLLTHLVSGLRLSGARFALSPAANAVSLAGLATGNILISILTLGMAAPVAQMRKFRYCAERLEIVKR